MQSIEKIGERFWYQTPVSETDRPILGVVVGDNRTLMIDAGNSEAHACNFLEEIEKINLPIPQIVVITHWHWDHIFGLSSLGKMISISSLKTKEEMEKLIPFSWEDKALNDRVRAGIEIEFCATAIKKEFGTNRNIKITLPTMTFNNSVEIDLGGVTCILEHVGGDHAQDSTVVYIKEEKILFLADCIYADIYSRKRRYTIQRITSLLEHLEKFEAEYYVLSHWKPISKNEFNSEVSLLRKVASYTETFQGDFSKIKATFEESVDRKLTEDELETIEYFVNGYEND